MPKKPKTDLEMAMAVAQETNAHIEVDGDTIRIDPGRPFNHPIDENLPIEGVYFIKCNEFIKIGFARDHKQRIKALQTCNPYELSLVKFVQGGMQQEREFHERFKQYRHRLEWFKNEGDLKDFLEGDDTP